MNMNNLYDQVENQPYFNQPFQGNFLILMNFIDNY